MSPLVTPLVSPRTIWFAFSYATMLSRRKTRRNVPSTSARYFLVQLSATAIYFLLLICDQMSRDDACTMVPISAPFAPPLAAYPTKKALTCTLQSERIGQDFSLHVPPVAAGLFIAHESGCVNRQFARRGT